VSLPLIEPAPPADAGRELTSALGELDRFEWIVFTSSNAVTAVRSRISATPRALPAVAVVGPATADAVADAGWVVAFEPSEATAATLAAELPIRTGDRVLAPLAERAADTIVEGLSRRGAVVRRVEAYRMDLPIPAPELVGAAASADAVLLTSPSIALRFAAVVGTGVPVVIAIGPSTADAARAAGFTVTSVADPHDEGGMLDALTGVFGPNG
jgi:uroporphyrinogen-III synthase